jgi:hypothetical protein
MVEPHKQGTCREKMTVQLDALAILVIIGALAAVVLLRIPQDQLSQVFSGNVGAIAGGLFVLLLLVQLIQPQAWMPDVLKVVAGVVAGAVAAKKSDARLTEDLKNQQIAIGEQIQQAARDINNVQSQLSKIEGSVVNQHLSAAPTSESIVAYKQYDRLRFEYADNPDVREAYETAQRDSRNGLEYKPIGEEEERAWYDRQIELFRKIPNGEDALAKRVEELRAHGWEVTEVRFDFSGVAVDVILSVEKRLGLPSEGVNKGTLSPGSDRGAPKQTPFTGGRS